MKLSALLAAAAMCAGLLSAQTGMAADTDYPDQTVHLIVPFSAGGATDVLARLVADGLSKEWGQPVVVENRPGATGAIAAEFVKKATPDGYTILVGTASVNSVAPSVRDDLPYDTLKDFAPIANIAVFPNLLVVNPSIEVKTVPEFIQLLKDNPGEYNFASSGIGSSIHLTGELFKQATGTDMVHIPYKGSAPARTDLLAGNVNVMFDNMSSVLPLVDEGRLVALGVTGAERDPTRPDIPAIAETVAGFDATSWIGLMAPAGTPQPVLDKVAKAVGDVISQPDAAEKMTNLGLTPVASSPEKFGAFLAADIEKWRNVVEQAGIALH